MKALGVVGVVLLLFALWMLFNIIVREQQSLTGWWRERKLRHAPWEATTGTLPDGTMEIAIKKPGEKARPVKALPPGMDPIDFRSELQIALEDAEDQARVLNRQR